MGYAKRREFKIGGEDWIATKSMFAGPAQRNARGEWIYYWYARPAAASNAKESWIPIGRTLADLESWIKAKRMRATGIAEFHSPG